MADVAEPECQAGVEPGDLADVLQDGSLGLASAAYLSLCTPN